jgi:hypothetical protein
MFKPPTFVDYSKFHNNLESLPLIKLGQTCTRANFEAEVITMADSYGLAKSTWAYPQAIAHVGRWNLSRNETGKYSAKNLLRDNVSKSDLNKGVYWFLMTEKRFLAKAYAQTEFCVFTPLILSAFKKMCGVQYSEWDPEELHLIVPPNLLEAMFCIPAEYSVGEIFQFRVTGLTIGSGPKAGQLKSAVTTHGLAHLPSEMLDGRPGPGSLPSLARMMLCQTWCAHPQNRSKYSILDPRDWDRMPPPLIDDTPEGVRTRPAKARLSMPDLDWLGEDLAPALGPEKMPWD